MNVKFLLFYIVFLLLIVIFSFLFIDPNLIYLKLLFTDFALRYRIITTIFYITSIVIFFIFYILFLRGVQKRKLNVTDGKIILGITITILLFSYPAMLSFDIFNYIATAKVLFFYHENPYLIMPIAFTHDPLLLFMHAPNKVALYGFAWILSSGIPYVLGFNNFLITLLNFKVFTALFYIGIIILIWKITKNLYSVILFSVNPLVIIEILISGHNDSMMMFFALLSFYFINKNKKTFALLSLVMSIFIKYATIALIPVFIYVFVKTILNQKVPWDKVFFTAMVSMLVVFFFVAPLREEIYPWYAIWILSFSALIPQYKFLQYFLISLSFGLLLRYVPFMLLGTYFGITPAIKIGVTILPPIFVSFYIIVLKLFKTSN